MTTSSVQITPTISVNFNRMNITNTTDMPYCHMRLSFYPEQTHMVLVLHQKKNMSY